MLWAYAGGVAFPVRHVVEPTAAMYRGDAACGEPVFGDWQFDMRAPGAPLAAEICPHCLALAEGRAVAPLTNVLARARLNSLAEELVRDGAEWRDIEPALRTELAHLCRRYRRAA